MKREKDKKYIKEYETYGTQLDDLKNIQWEFQMEKQKKIMTDDFLQLRKYIKS